MKIALVHDDLVQWGGAEKVLSALTRIFPEAPIYTSVFDQTNKLILEKFQNKRIITSFMQKIPGWKIFYRPFLPLYPLAFEQFDFSEYDLVISQTTKFAKAIITKPETKHICLMHTPPRFLWHLPSDKPNRWLGLYFSFLRMYDRIASRRVDCFIAGSINCQTRIKQFYQTDSTLVQPFVDDHIAERIATFDGGYYLLIARLNGYKNVQLVVETFNKMGKELKIVGQGGESSKLKKMANKNIKFYQGVSEAMLSSLLAGCKGLIVSAEEDFGLTSLEAQIFGKGVIAYGYGGSLETVIAGKTGVYFHQQTVESLEQAVTQFEELKIDPASCVKNAKQFSLANFEVKMKNIVEKVSSK